MDDAAFDALPQADRDYLVDRLVAAYYDIATIAPGGQADGPAFRSTRLTQEGRNRLAVVGGGAPIAAERIVIRTSSAGESVFIIQGREMSIHASQQATARGISNESIANAMDQQPFSYVQNGQTHQGYYDVSINTFVGVGDRITTAIRPSNPTNYLNNLRDRQ